MATYYINADTGNDGNAGGSGDPWLTLAHAFNNTIAGDTIVCQDSAATYAFANDTFDHNITIRGEQDNASGAVFDGGAGTRRWIIRADVTIENLTLQNALCGSFQAIIQLDSDGVTLDCSNVRFYNLTLGNGTRRCVIGIIAAKLNITVNLTACLFWDIIATGGNATGVLLTGTDGTTSDWDITGCSFFTGDTGKILSSSGLTASINVAVTIINGVFSHSVAVNFYNISGVNAPVVAASYSCFHNMTGAPGGVGTITSDPLFIDSDNGDFRLRPDSPCIDTGTLP